MDEITEVMKRRNTLPDTSKIRWTIRWESEKKMASPAKYYLQKYSGGTGGKRRNFVREKQSIVEKFVIVEAKAVCKDREMLLVCVALFEDSEG